MNKVHGRVLILVCSGILTCQGYVAYRVHQHYETFNGLRQVAPRLYRSRYSFEAPATHLYIPNAPQSIPNDDPPAPPPPESEPEYPTHTPPTSLPSNLQDGHYRLEEIRSEDVWWWNGEEWIKMPSV